MDFNYRCGEVFKNEITIIRSITLEKLKYSR